MSYEADIQWFPGHMTKTRRQIEADIKQVDAVAEIVDARIPEASRNPLLNELVGEKPRILIMNKCDCADDRANSEWKKYYEGKGYSVLLCDCRSGKGINAFLPLLKKSLAELLERRKAKGMIGKPLRVMVVGIPNVGKSSFINRLAGSRKAKVEDRPGVTRGKQWVSLDKDAELLDTPGILYPKFDDKKIALKLAFTGAIKDDIMDIEALAEALAERLREDYSAGVCERYKLENFSNGICKAIAEKRGMKISGGELDTERAAITFVDEFRSGKLGKISLERPGKK